MSQQPSNLGVLSHDTCAKCKVQFTGSATSNPTPSFGAITIDTLSVDTAQTPAIAGSGPFFVNSYGPVPSVTLTTH